MRANAPFRNAAADQCQCGRRPPARSPGCACSSPPLPHRLFSTAPAQDRHGALGLDPKPRGRRASSPPEISSAMPHLRGATCAAEGESEASERPGGGLPGPLPSPSHRPSQRRARDGRPVHPASPLPPSQAPHAGHYPSTPHSPPNTSSPRRRRRRPESGWGRPGGGFTSILRPDSPLPTRVQYGTERKRRDQLSRDALSARRRSDGGGAS